MKWRIRRQGFQGIKVLRLILGSEGILEVSLVSGRLMGILEALEVDDPGDLEMSQE